MADSSIWFNLGTVQPNYQEWEMFDMASVNAPILRITFSAVDGLPFEKMYSWVRIRRIWNSFSPAVVEPSFAVYPKNNPTIIHHPLHPDYKNAGLLYADYQIKQFAHRYDYGNEEPQYVVTLEEQ